MSQAISLLREAGRDDLASFTEEEAFPDPLQREIIAYLKETGF